MTKGKIISLEIINCESVFKQAYNKNFWHLYLTKKFYPIKNIVFRITQRECADIVSILGGKSNFETNLQNIPTDKIRNEYCYS